jgi:hypothetical protein
MKKSAVPSGVSKEFSGIRPFQYINPWQTGFIPPQKALALRLKFPTRHKRRWRRKFYPGSRPPVSHGLMLLLRIQAYRHFVPAAKLWVARKM